MQYAVSVILTSVALSGVFIFKRVPTNRDVEDVVDFPKFFEIF